MLKFPDTRDEWIIATVSAFAGFFGGGAIIAVSQRLTKRVIYKR